MAEKKYIIFTDLKDFTYKTSLLTDKQVEDILGIFHNAVSGSAKEYDVKVVKSIGDAYFITADVPEKAILFSQSIVKIAKAYDAKQKIAIKKIALRVTISYGNISQNTHLDLEDYFGEAINIGSRIMDITPQGHIFCTKEVSQTLPKKLNSGEKYIGDFSFHGVLEALPIYSLTDISEEEIEKIKQHDDSKLQESENLVFRSSCVAGMLSVQPLPILENANLLAVHLYMIYRIGDIFGNQLSLKESSKIFSNLIAPLGVSYATFQGSASLIKILLPGVGGYIFAPVSFAVSYALGKIYILYFFYKASGETLGADDVKDLFMKHKKEGKKLAKKRKNEILEIGKKYSSEVLCFGKKQEFTKVQEDTIKMLKKT